MTHIIADMSIFICCVRQPASARIAAFLRVADLHLQSTFDDCYRKKVHHLNTIHLKIFFPKNYPLHLMSAITEFDTTMMSLTVSGIVPYVAPAGGAAVCIG